MILRTATRLASPLLLSLATAGALRAQCPDGAPPPCRNAAPARMAAPPPGSIAVLPFVNRSPDSSDAYLAEALPEQIIARLARVSDLRVKSATVVSAQWRRTPDPMAAARALRVEWFVTGSIRRSGRQLAVTTELVRSASGDGAWTAPFRRGDDDLASVEEQVAESVAVAIVGRLAPAQSAALRVRATRNPEAYRLYLYGRTLMARRIVPDIARAVAAFTETVRLDPQFAAGWARLGMARGLQVQWGGAGNLSQDSLRSLAADAASRALRLDSGLAEAWTALGQVLYLRADLGRANEALQRALQLDSSSADVWHTAGYIYSVDFLDLPEPGRRYYRQAVSLDPDLRNSWRHLAMLERDAGNLALSEALLDTALARGAWGPGFTDRSWVRYLRGNVEGALADLAAAEQTGSIVASILINPFTVTPAVLRAVYRTRLGDSSVAREALARVQSTPDTGMTYFQESLLLTMALGLHDQALTLLERLRHTKGFGESRCGEAFCSTSLATWEALHDPSFAPLHGNARYQRLLDETRPRVPWLEGR